MKTIAIAALAGLVVGAVGCAPNAIVGNGATGVGPFYGDVGIVGHSANVTITRGSKVPKLSIQGNNCTVTVDDGAWVGRVEFWGSGSTVSIPEDLIIRPTQVGANYIVRRPRPLRPSDEWPSYEETATPPATRAAKAAPGPVNEPAPKTKTAPATGENTPPLPEPLEPGPEPTGQDEGERK